MNGQQIVYDFLDENNISYEYISHPQAPTIEIAKQYISGDDVVLCKNLFFATIKVTNITWLL